MRKRGARTSASAGNRADALRLDLDAGDRKEELKGGTSGKESR
ncbi:MAG TPA: hypothetical protein PKN52_00450 [Trueperaceae bacterium]|jgi:hypothetical protein|nr:hypothetical protein [Trueperaceae bacterium]